MNRFKKNKEPKNLSDGIINSPGRRGRKIIGEHQGPSIGLREDGSNRRLDDFNRPSGYHPSQPLVTGRMANNGMPDEKARSMLNMTLPGDNVETDKKANKPKRERQKTDWYRWGRRIKRVAALGIVAVVLIAGYVLIKGLHNLEKVFGGSGSNIQAIVSPDALHTEGDGNVNVLLLGEGGVGHDGPDLTDTMLLVSIDPVNSKAYLLSIPRDLWVNVPGSGYMKINAVYETGKWKYLGTESDSDQNRNAVYAGFNLDNKVASSILGIPIKYDALANFQAFQQVVDTLGGVSVNVPSELYDPTIAWQNGGNPVIAEPGAQNFNGAKALLYVRSRETTSDFARTQRQRQILLAIKSKALTLGTLSNPLKISKLSDEFGNNIVSNLSLADVNTLYGIVSKINNGQIQSIGLADPPNNYVTTGSVGGQSVDAPTAGANNYSAIQYYVRNTLRDGYLTKENANIMVLNGSSNPDLANNEANTLKSYGYNVTSVGTAPSQNYKGTELIDLTNGSDRYTLHYLELRLGVKAINTLPDSSIQPGSANFVIIVG